MIGLLEWDFWHTMHTKSFPDNTIKKYKYKKGNKYKNCRRKLYHCSPGENGLTIIPSNSLLNIALKNHGNIAKLWWLLSTTKVLSQATSWYTSAMFSEVYQLTVIYIDTMYSYYLVVKVSETIVLCWWGMDCSKNTAVQIAQYHPYSMLY